MAISEAGYRKMIKIKAALIWQPRKSICVLEPDDSAWK